MTDRLAGINVLIEGVYFEFLFTGSIYTPSYFFMNVVPILFRQTLHRLAKNGFL